MRTNSDVTLHYYGETGWRNAEKSLRTLLVSVHNINTYPITFNIRCISKTYRMRTIYDIIFMPIIVILFGPYYVIAQQPSRKYDNSDDVRRNKIKYILKSRIKCKRSKYVPIHYNVIVIGYYSI